MVKAEHLTKYYGDFLALNDVSFEFGENKVYGLLGPNGAGKSTTMNIMTGCLSATEGKVTIDGHDIYEEPQKAKSLIGYLPEFPPLYVNETPDEYLRFVGEAKGVKGERLKNEIEEVVAQTGIEEVRDRLISSLSKGYRQRVGIAQALLGDPQVIILDEPTVGLDPLQIIEIRELIKSLGNTHTVILSSHILSEVQMICEEVLIISRGQVAAFGTPAELETIMAPSGVINITTEASEDETREIIKTADETLTDLKIYEAGKGLLNISINIGKAEPHEVQRKLFYAFTSAGKTILEMSTSKANLEDVFIELTEGNAAESEVAQGTLTTDIMSAEEGNAAEGEMNQATEVTDISEDLAGEEDSSGLGAAQEVDLVYADETEETDSGSETTEADDDSTDKDQTQDADSSAEIQAKEAESSVEYAEADADSTSESIEADADTLVESSKADEGSASDSPDEGGDTDESDL